MVEYTSSPSTQDADSKQFKANLGLQSLIQANQNFHKTDKFWSTHS